ncbi:hypothetical protein Maq22A_c15165 [Methylobacterium aquaticum]|uniref:Uncharacterized protein n=1 Tax=Methylobacterium aquaticum TaxID=270351 RepID=A0A0C6F0W3_9HYPH|nr:hypothetical protein Maq22A_c15165 [Methylobacterium aquaticum]
MTLPARLCSLRQRAVRLAYRLSNSCTAVVTTTGASQFSAARRNRETGSRPVPSSRVPSSRDRAAAACQSKVAWCSRMPASSPSAVRNTAAVCSMIAVNGATWTTRRRPCRAAWSRAKVSEASVLPPPVGTVRVKSPGFRAARSRTEASTSARTALTRLGGAAADTASMWARSRACRVAIPGWPPRGTGRAPA